MDDATRSHHKDSHEGADLKVQRVMGIDGYVNKSSHRRSQAGDMLSSLPSQELSKGAASNLSTKEERHDDNVEGATKGSTTATTLRQRQSRKRTGSLRKAAMAKMRERSSSLSRQSNSTSPDNEVIPRLTRGHPLPNHPSMNNLESTAKVRASIVATTSSTESYASTTDEDETISFYEPSTSSCASSLHAPLQSATMPLSRRRSNRSERHTSPSIEAPSSDLESDDEWDYSETEWWGWVLLIATWVVFVVGMGSCLGVWSWAWDVGETPYAPPDLEDDATLPITGYYPALMVCTAVMSWVWVVVAWVGMKYFRHSKVVGDEG